MSRVLISAGDASGDLHAAALVRALRAREPDLRVQGIGGDEMEKEGVELVFHQREVAVGGLVEVLGALRRVASAWRELGRSLENDPPDLVVLVDSPDLNLPFARKVKKAGIPILYYIAPQVWAWRRGRVRKLARRVDRLAVIFPFEVDFFAGTGLPVDFVGHPLVDRIGEFLSRHDRAQAREALGVAPEERLVLLLPGSRKNELHHGLVMHLDTARALHARDPELRFAIGLAPTMSREAVQPVIDAAGLPKSLRLDLVCGRTYEAALAADVALAMPGTMTVELTLLRCPFVVAVQVNPISAMLARRLIRVPFVAMPNLIAGGPAVPEFLQEGARPDRIAEAVWDLLSGPAREAQLARLAVVRERLGPGGAAERTAEIAQEMLRGAPGA